MRTNIETLTAVRDRLVRARDLLLTKGWTQYVGARDANGFEVASNGPCATCFCAVGAVMASGADAASWVAAVKALDEATPSYIVHFNDAAGRTRAEVVAVFDEAVRQLDVEIRCAS